MALKKTFNPYAAGGSILQTQNDPKKLKNYSNPGTWVTHLRVLGESYPMNTNTTGFRWFSKIKICVLVLWA